MRFNPRAAWLLILLLTLPGCWDLEEADYRSFITAIGIDSAPGPGGASPPERQVILTAQVPLIAEMLPPGTRGGGKREKNYHTVSAPGGTLYEAFRSLQGKINRHVVIQQNKLVVLGRETARRDVAQFLQWLERNAKHPPQALLFVARRTAREILNAEPADKNMPAFDFGIAREIGAKHDFTYFIPLWLFREKLINRSEDAYAPLLDFDAAQGQYVLTGLAVFNGNRMAGALTPEETRMFGLLTGQMRDGGLTVRRGPQRLSLENVAGKTRLKISLRRGEPFFGVTVTVQGAVDEVLGFDGELSLPMLKRLEHIVARDLRTRITAAIGKLQQLNSDPIDFGEQLRIQHPAWWARHRWKRVFPTAPFWVSVKAAIVRDGVLR